MFDKLGRHSISGIRATIFGATGFAGPYIGTALGMIGSDLLFPHNHEQWWNDEVKTLKLCAPVGNAYTLPKFNLDDEDLMDRVIKNSNVVINLLGPRGHVKSRSEFEYINVEVAKKIAKACAKNEKVIRLIHFSAAGA